jgi:hypothetical protein
MKIFLALIICYNAHASYLVKRTIENGTVSVISTKKLETSASKTKILKNIRESISEKEKTKDITYQEVIYPDHLLPSGYEKFIISNKSFWPDSEIREIVKTGNDNNRITISILGDGYTLNEKEKFFTDVKRMTKDMFQEVTFKSYLSLFNIYAIFTPSEESGISDLTTKRTAFDLYRSPKGSKRGIMPGNRSAIEKALNLVSANTDYPIIIANDDFYGGLGGRYAITTRSLTSGSMVLRHELGHNFSNVGEEYDGGQVYSGANFSNNSNVPWTHWIDGTTSVNDSKFLTGSYVWQDLGKKDFELDFNFPSGEGYSYDLRLSSVGWESKDDVEVLLDGTKLELDGLFTEDRSFFQTVMTPLTTGTHTIKIQDSNRDGNNVLAYANGYAYPKDYNFTPNVVGAFNVFRDGGNRAGYRPTHNQCLMRDMRSKIFCPVDQENIWFKFLDRISLIDKMNINGFVYSLELLDVETISIKWFKKEGWSSLKEITSLRDMKTVDLSSYGKGKYEVHAELTHPEIRKKSDSTKDIKEFKVR